MEALQLFNLAGMHPAAAPYFPAIHLPTDIFYAEYEPIDVATLYDRGGLPQTGFESLLYIVPTINISYRIQF